jgi:hypothetical protein
MKNKMEYGNRGEVWKRAGVRDEEEGNGAGVGRQKAGVRKSTKVEECENDLEYEKQTGVRKGGGVGQPNQEWGILVEYGKGDGVGIPVEWGSKKMEWGKEEEWAKNRSGGIEIRSGDQEMEWK